MIRDPLPSEQAAAGPRQAGLVASPGLQKSGQGPAST